MVEESKGQTLNENPDLAFDVCNFMMKAWEEELSKDPNAKVAIRPSKDPEILERQIKENLESVDTEIKDDDSSLEGIQKNMEEALKPLNDIVDSVSEIGTDYETINKEINKNPNDDAKAQELIENEIKKVESLKKKVESKIKSIDTMENSRHMTNWWNGMGYDF